jgi:hypothetical protein
MTWIHVYATDVWVAREYILTDLINAWLGDDT